MQVKKITAKIRDMVKVSLMENGDERAWYNNIEMPDAIKELEMKDCHFNFLIDGKIEFQIHFEQGVLPKEFPPKKARKHRAAKTAVDTAPKAPEVTAIAVKVDDTPDATAAPDAAKPDSKTDAKPIEVKVPGDKPVIAPKDIKASSAPITKPGPKTDGKPKAAPAKPGKTVASPKATKKAI